MPFELERRDGVPGISVCQQIQQYGRPGEAVIPGWLKTEHLYGVLWLTTPKTRAARRFVPLSICGRASTGSASTGSASARTTDQYTHRDTALLAALLDQAIPDLHDDVIDAEVIEKTA